MSPKLLFTLFVIASIGFAVVSASDFDPDRVHVIDVYKNNILFRGNEPTVNTTFIYGQLTDRLRYIALKEANITLGDFYLVDFSLLSIEFTSKNVESAFFKQNPSLGEWFSWPIFGDLLPPYDVPESLRKTMAKKIQSWQIDDLPKTMDLLHSWLQRAYDKPLVIYVHCEAGKDRTGEVSGSYYMRYLGWEFAKALYYDNHVVHGTRDIMNFSRNAMQWYCYYLKYSQNYNIDCTVPQHP
jgi:protein-tyrosine phosphatase